MTTHRLTSVRFTRYKAFKNYQLSLQDFNVLVGPNNSGKSTIIGVFRILAEGLRKARSRSPEPINTHDYSGLGYKLNIGDLPISAENIFFEYDDSQPAEVKFRVSNGNHLRLYFPEQRTCYLIAECAKRIPRSPSQFKAEFDIEIGFVPILGPVEQRERLFEKEAARLALLTSGASRNFRNIWYHYPDDFDRFKDLVANTWPGMGIKEPEVIDAKHLAMFCPEGRYPRELCWAGYGFQVWCQMLTFVVKASSASILVIDEPDIYLHSDLQRQLVSLLRDLGPDILIATHSTEIIAECEPISILTINKKKQSAQRVKDVSQLKHVFSALGSNLNPTLTQLAKTKRVVFVEGLDFQIFSRFAQALGQQRIANRADFAVVQMEGFNPKRAIDLANGIDAAVGEQVARAVILDKDYRCNDEVAEIKRELTKSNFHVHIHQRKELENYLLEPNVIARAVNLRLKEKARRSGDVESATPDIYAIVGEAMEAVRHETFAQIQAREVDYLRRKSPHIDSATIIAQISKRFDEDWHCLEKRLMLVPGKTVLAKVNAKLQELVGVALSDGQIAQQFKANEIHADILGLIDGLVAFCDPNVEP